ncbi:MAG: hypothetical protein WBE18_05540 [Gammaproteobacteria bacterium]
MPEGNKQVSQIHPKIAFKQAEAEYKMVLEEFCQRCEKNDTDFFKAVADQNNKNSKDYREELFFAAKTFPKIAEMLLLRAHKWLNDEKILGRIKIDEIRTIHFYYEGFLEANFPKESASFQAYITPKLEAAVNQSKELGEGLSNFIKTVYHIIIILATTSSEKQLKEAKLVIDAGIASMKEKIAKVEEYLASLGEGIKENAKQLPMQFRLAEEKLAAVKQKFADFVKTVWSALRNTETQTISTTVSGQSAVPPLKLPRPSVALEVPNELPIAEVRVAHEFLKKLETQKGYLENIGEKEKKELFQAALNNSEAAVLLLNSSYARLTPSKSGSMICAATKKEIAQILEKHSGNKSFLDKIFLPHSATKAKSLQNLCVDPEAAKIFMGNNNLRKLLEKNLTSKQLADIPQYINHPPSSKQEAEKETAAQEIEREITSFLNKTENGLSEKAAEILLGRYLDDIENIAIKDSLNDPLQKDIHRGYVNRLTAEDINSFVTKYSENKGIRELHDMLTGKNKEKLTQNSNAIAEFDEIKPHTPNKPLLSLIIMNQVY